MARTPINSINQITSTDLESLYTVISGIDTIVSSMSFTNLNATAKNITVYHYQSSSTTDFKKTIIHLPAGDGRERIYYGMGRAVFATSDIIKVQSDSATAFNAFVYGSEVEV